MPVNAERGPGAGNPAARERQKKGAVDCTAAQAVAAGPAGERNGQFRHDERTKAAIAERQKFSTLLKLLRWAEWPRGSHARFRSRPRVEPEGQVLGTLCERTGYLT